jgi:histidinol-phosphate aminotransferase
MPLTRRGFFNVLGAGNDRDALASMLSQRGREAEYAFQGTQGAAGQAGQGQGGQGQGGGRGGGRGGGAPRPQLPEGVEIIRISSNENPLGPGKAALDAITGKFPEAGRYPFNSTPNDAALTSAIASKFKIKPEHIVLGGGSQEILKNAVRAFTTPARGLVTGAPSFQNCPGVAKKLGHPIKEIKVDSLFRLDLEAMIDAATGAGLVFFNNPNNPTATVHGAKVVADFVSRVRRSSPDTVILIDEAYHDYVTDPSYESAIPLALETPNVFVTRTFSKAYGMAGMRVGYAVGRADTMKPLEKLKMPYNISVLGIGAAIAALGDAKHIATERDRNTKVRAFTARALEELACKTAVSHANFVFADVGKPAKEFRDACAKQGVVIGRDFPPFEKTHVRISIGTMDEMQKAVAVFRSVLRPATTTDARGIGEASWR